MNVGLIGCGMISAMHLKAWAQIEGAKLVAVSDETERQAAVTATRWGAQSSYVDIETMLRKEQLQFLSVCTPPLTHTDIVCQALESGVNVICEKPLAMTTKEVDRMKAKARAGNAKLAMICNLLYNPEVIRAQRILESLQQKPKLVEIQILKSPNSQLSRQKHWSHNLPGGAFGDLLIHPIYLVRHFLGDLAVKSIHMLNHGTHEWMKYDELRASLESPEKQASIVASFNSPREYVIMDLYGEKNALRVDLINHDVFLLRDYKRRYAGKAAEALMQLSVTIDNGLSSLREAVSYHSKRIHSPHQRNIRSFVASVLNGTVPPISFEDMHTLVSTQERITGLIDSYDSL